MNKLGLAVSTGDDHDVLYVNELLEEVKRIKLWEIEIPGTSYSIANILL